MRIPRILCIVSGMAIAGAILLTLDTTFQGVFDEPVGAAFARAIEGLLGSSPTAVVRAVLFIVALGIMGVGGVLGNCCYLLLTKLLRRLAHH